MLWALEFAFWPHSHKIFAATAATATAKQYGKLYKNLLGQRPERDPSWWTKGRHNVIVIVVIVPGPGPGQVADRVQSGGRRSDESRLTGATQPQQQQQQHNSSSRHNSNNNNKDFYCPNKRQTKDSLAALPAASAGEHSRIAIFIILFAYKRSHISASVSPTHTHTHPHTRLNLYLQI